MIHAFTVVHGNEPLLFAMIMGQLYKHLYMILLYDIIIIELYYLKRLFRKTDQFNTQ